MGDVGVDTLQTKRILVTGGSGFIASHLVRRLVKAGADVGITTKYNSIIDNVRLVDVWDKLHVMEADLRNVDSLRQVADFKPQIVYHFAAYNHVGDSFLHVNEALESNTVGTANLIESYDGYERFVYISSSEVYGDQGKVPFQEEMIPQPASPYGVGKYGGELYCRMKMKDCGRPVVILRPFNAFGPYQSPRAVIAEMIIKCLRGETITATKGIQTREFNFVENLVDGFLLAGEKEEAVGQMMNLASGREIAIKDLIEMIHRATESTSELQIGKLPYRPTEIWRMSGDAARANAVLGWQPRLTFEEGLQRTIVWYRAFLKEFLEPASALARLGSLPE